VARARAQVRRPRSSSPAQRIKSRKGSLSIERNLAAELERERANQIGEGQELKLFQISSGILGPRPDLKFLGMKLGAVIKQVNHRDGRSTLKTPCPSQRGRPFLPVALSRGKLQGNEGVDPIVKLEYSCTAGESWRLIERENSARRTSVHPRQGASSEAAGKARDRGFGARHHNKQLQLDEYVHQRSKPGSTMTTERKPVSKNATRSEGSNRKRKPLKNHLIRTKGRFVAAVLGSSWHEI